MDNTFLTPALQRPLELGADISVLSTTKYIDGHNATVGGSLATNDGALAERFRLIRKWLDAHPAVARVCYPGLKSFPQQGLALRQQRAAGGMLSFELDATNEIAVQVINSVQLCSRAESLGGVETLITHPASTTHADLGHDLRAHLGISEGLILCQRRDR